MNQVTVVIQNCQTKIIKSLTEQTSNNRTATKEHTQSIEIATKKEDINYKLAKGLTDIHVHMKQGGTHDKQIHVNKDIGVATKPAAENDALITEHKSIEITEKHDTDNDKTTQEDKEINTLSHEVIVRSQRKTTCQLKMPQTIPHNQQKKKSKNENGCQTEATVDKLRKPVLKTIVEKDQKSATSTPFRFKDSFV